MNQYRRGRSFEYWIIRYFESLGYYCIRSAASKGKYDIIAIKDRSTFFLIQAKIASKVSNKLFIQLKEIQFLEALLNSDSKKLKNIEELNSLQSFHEFSTQFYEILILNINKKKYFLANFE